MIVTTYIWFGLFYWFNGKSTLDGSFTPKFLNIWFSIAYLNCTFLFGYTYFIYTWHQEFLSNTNTLHTVVEFQVFWYNTNNLHTVVCFQEFQSNTNNLHTVGWFQIFLSNTNNFHTVVWFQVFLSNTNNLHTVVRLWVFLSNTNNLRTISWFQVFISNTNNPSNRMLLSSYAYLIIIIIISLPKTK